ncbi:hypothetical protein BP00DRAFT_427270 [Aspergillus indologenus CBS 114.80]|uniref:Protein kinase domain-containing protein n=1 Tax=Aspergillus indologenus CBS 114.80 TaxID=1450541 RepID=A0A2V5I0R6_9EURO|nr:hypothetical protein BP00DRAFT_427270 [Aspergillus indologenus CBS 114.80]
MGSSYSETYDTATDPFSLKADDDLTICKSLQHSEASSVYEVMLKNGKNDRYCLKVYHDNGEHGYSKKGRDLYRFRCELNAYRNLRLHGVCQNGVVPYFYGYFNELDPALYRPYLNHFENDVYKPKAILPEYLPNAEGLNCLNYSDQRFEIAIRGLSKIHEAHVLHYDVYPKNILLVPGHLG